MKIYFFSLFLMFFIATNVFSDDQNALTVHEWGTITTQHYNNGVVAGYLNRIRKEEMLPDFVHRLDAAFTETESLQKIAVTDDREGQDQNSNGVNLGHPDVIMRLETPVIYFYPSEKFDLSQKINVDVEFYGGLINEYYPNAEASYVDQDFNSMLPRLTEKLIGKLSWKDIELGKSGNIPQTDFNVWLEPRNTKSSFVHLPNGENEKYLFYRGVAHLNSLLRTKHTMDTKVISLYSPTDLPSSLNENLTLSQVWIVQINADGTAAFKEVGKVVLSKDPEQVLASVSANFPKEEYATKNLDLLKQSIQTELVKNGLFEEEAQAMLKTWDKTYFRNPGTRIFFMVPKEWVNYYLPLKFSVPVNLERVLIGRIDLVI